MSTKQRLVQVIETLPESVTIEEAVERLYRAFQLKPILVRTGQADQPLLPLPTLEGSIPEGWKDAIYE